MFRKPENNLLGLLFFIFTFVVAFGQNSFFISENDSFTDQVKSVFTQDHNDGSSFPDLLSSKTEEQEVSKDNETKESFKDFAPGLSGIDFSVQRIDHHWEKTLLSQLNYNIRNRSQVSLFILHHSWKSFLA